jgi:hypothetical protein
MEEPAAEREEIAKLIEELEKYDNEAGYGLEYKEVRRRLEATIRELVNKGEKCLEHLHPLLEHPGTWSCLFALETIKGIRSEKSVLPLVNYIRSNEDGDYWEGCEEAMYALSNIGEPAAKILLGEVKADFERKVHLTFLVGALTRIKSDDVYSFMVEVTEDYFKNPEKYEGWFNIGLFTYEFESQGKGEILPLLRRLLGMRGLRESDRREIRDTAKSIEDPAKFKEEIRKLARQTQKPVPHSKKKKIGRNDPCPCGSGKKYKKCCLDK